MSKHINTPTITNVTDDGDNTATFVIEPLHTGYGMTLGNSIRRVLLSSIAGAAITSFRIEGATHEFTALDGVKEDVVDIMQNLKGIRFKVFSDQPQSLTIEKKGDGAVTAADIKTNADVEVVNTEHHIATLDGAKATFKAEIVVETGRGYRTIEDTNAKKSSDFISLDAIFSPVLRVRYKVENTRVGQMTNLDKLSVSVATDGTITPADAFEEANAILMNQYEALAGKTRVEARPMLVEAHPESSNASEDDEKDMLTTSIEDLNFSARTTNALINNDIHNLKDLFSLTDAELKDLKGFGSKALDEVREKLAELEL
ncbi:MAG TPA: DNA-directed RNA polymerase subunit alpha [Candidatus Saccharibacteria bacterium]|jgi:DNA-directed RNA polymerase subunit alpha|nr:DNA-directed RNA polymerase subunit alpha [Candidatus Saccharibacteria bacterium]HMT55375.1 DNA-directed RNA polymerase subunit alpha [Candidatus Saccharibacteria bacterium]